MFCVPMYCKPGKSRLHLSEKEKNGSRPAIQKAERLPSAIPVGLVQTITPLPGHKQKRFYFFKKNVFSEFALSVGAYTLSLNWICTFLSSGALFPATTTTLLSGFSNASKSE